MTFLPRFAAVAQITLSGDAARLKPGHGATEEAASEAAADEALSLEAAPRSRLLLFLLPPEQPLRAVVVRDQLLAGNDAEAFGLSGGDFEHRARTARKGDSPRLHVRHDLPHDEVTVEEDGVDREPHEEHVNRRRRAQEQSFARSEPVAAEEAFHSAQRRRRDAATLAKHRAVFAR